MKKKIVILLSGSFLTILNLNHLSAQQTILTDVTATRTTQSLLKSNIVRIEKEVGADNNLMITSPVTGTNLRGSEKITGKANPNSSVKIEVNADYYKYSPDYKASRLKQGDGPFTIGVKNIIVKANSKGFWNVNPFTFKNYGFSTTFKIVARSVEGKNATYVTVENKQLPAFCWE